MVARLKQSRRILALLGFGGTTTPTGYVIGTRVHLRATVSDRMEFVANFNCRLDGRLTSSAPGSCDMEYGISEGPGRTLVWVFGLATVVLLGASALTASALPLLVTLVPATIFLILLVTLRVSRPFQSAGREQLMGFVQEVQADLAGKP
jgi:hypothetical protein